MELVARRITKLDWVVTVALAVAETAGGVLLTGRCFPAWLSFCLLCPLSTSMVKTSVACLLLSWMPSQYGNLP